MTTEQESTLKEQEPASKYNVLLIDLDNCPKQIENLPNTIEQYTRAVVCYGGAEPKVPLNLVTFLAKAINSGQLEIIGMQKKGKNAADFGLAFWAGRIMAELPPETEFIILSEDTDLDHVVNLLRSANRKATRINGKTKIVTINPIQDQKKLEKEINTKISDMTQIPSDVAKISDEVGEYFFQNLKPGRPRPRNKKTLNNNIKSYFKKRKEIKSEEILQGLVDREFIIIDGLGRVIYPDKEKPLSL